MDLETKQIELAIKERLERAITLYSKPYYSNGLTPSTLGHKCDRYLWLGLNWIMEPTTYNADTLRLFETGRLEEARMVEWLKMAGLTILDKDPNSEEQWEGIALGGHLKGRVDGIITAGMPNDSTGKYVLECKTHSQKSFDDLIDKGVFKSKIDHYLQIQLYMFLLKIDKGLYMAKNKNNDQLHFEIIHLDREYAKQVGDRARNILKTRSLPEQISKNPNFYLCKGFNCDFYDYCFGSAKIERNCRTCNYSNPINNGSWQCGKFDKVLKKYEQENGCEAHRYNLTLIKGEISYHNEDTDAYHYILDDGADYVDYGEE